MPGVMSSTQVGEAGGGPNSSLPFGEASQMEQMGSELKNAAPGAYAATRAPGEGGPPPGPQGGGPGGMPSPAGPPPAASQPAPPQEDQGQPFLQQPRLQPTWGWQKEMRLMASHPNAIPGGIISQLAKRLG